MEEYVKSVTNTFTIAFAFRDMKEKDVNLVRITFE